MLARLLAQLGHKLVVRLKDVVPAKKKTSGATAKCSQIFSQPAGTMPCMRTVAARSWWNASTSACVMAESASAPSAFLAPLGGIAPTLVGGAQVVVAHGERAVQLKGVHGLLERDNGLLGLSNDGLAQGTGGDAAVAVSGPRRPP